MLASDASSGSEWIGVQKPQGTAERQKHHADVGAEFEMQYSKKVKRMISAAKSVMPRMFFREVQRMIFEFVHGLAHSQQSYCVNDETWLSDLNDEHGAVSDCRRRSRRMRSLKMRCAMVQQSRKNKGNG